MALNIVLLVLGVLFIAAVIIALVRPHQKVKTKVKVLGAEFDLQAEGGEPAEPAASAAAPTPGIAAEGIHSGGAVGMRDGTGRGIQARDVEAAGDVNLEAGAPGRAEEGDDPKKV